MRQAVTPDIAQNITIQKNQITIYLTQHSKLILSNKMVKHLLEKGKF